MIQCRNWLTVNRLGCIRDKRDSDAMPVFLDIAAISCCNKFNLAFVRNLFAMSSYFPFSLKASFLLFLSDGFIL